MDKRADVAARAEWRVQAFCRRQNLGAGGIHFRRAFESLKGEAGQRPAKPKKKDMTCWSCLSFWSACPNLNPCPITTEQVACTHNCAIFSSF